MKESRPRSRSYGRKADLALTMWVKLARAHAVFSRKSADQIRTFGLTEAQFSALETLGHKGPMTFSELCGKLLVTGGNMTIVVDNLVRGGLVRRVPCEEDRRAVYVHLTQKGKDLFKSIFAQHAAHIERLASVLTAEEQKTLAALLKKLGRSLQDREEKKQGRAGG